MEKDYRVWDPRTSKEAWGEEIWAFDPRRAALKYAGEDFDNNVDAYCDGPHVIHVHCESSETLFVFEITAELDPTFTAKEVT